MAVAVNQRFILYYIYFAVKSHVYTVLFHGFAQLFMLRVQGASHVAYAELFYAVGKGGFHLNHHFKVVMLENSVIPLLKTYRCIKHGKVNLILLYRLNPLS